MLVQRQYTILMVDDSPEDRATYQRFLQQNSPENPLFQGATYHLIQVETGEAALAYCQQSLPDLLLIDYVLPDMTGLELLQSLKWQTGKDKLPVLVLTGQGNIELAVELMKNGALDYLDKNQMTAATLHRSIRSILQQMQLATELERQRQRQQLVAATALQIRQSLQLNDILQTTVQQVRCILECDRVVIYQFQPDWSGAVVVESVGAGWAPILGEVIHDPCLDNGWVSPYQQGSTTHHADILAEGLNTCYVNLMIRFQVRANLVVPILQGDQIWGLLIVHECAAPRQWQGAEVEFLSELAIQVSIAIQQAALVEQLQAELAERERTQQELSQKQVQLQESEATLRLLIQYAPVSIAMFDREMHYIMVSQRWIDDHQVGSIESHLGRSHYEVYADISERWKQIHQRCLAGATEKCDEDLYVRQDGSQQWMRWEARPWYRADHEVGGIIIFAEEVTARKQLELQLAQTAQRFSLVMELAQVGSWDWDLSTNEVAWNDTHYRLLGLTPTSVASNYAIWRQQIYPEDLQRVEDSLADSVANHRFYQSEYRVIWQDGTIRWLMSAGQTLADETGHAERMLGILIDITDRKQAEIALQQLNDSLEERIIERTEALMQANDRLQQELLEREKMQRSLAASEARFQTFMNHNPAAAWITDVNGNILYTNQTYQQTFQLPLTHLTEQSIFEVYNQESAQQLLSNIRSVVQTQQVLETVEAVPRIDGTLGDFLIYKFPLPDFSEHALVGGVAIDITNRRLMEEQLRQSEEKFRAIFDQAFQFIWLLKPSGVLLEANQTSLDFAAIQRLQVVNSPFLQAPWWRLSSTARERLKTVIVRAARGELVRLEVEIAGASNQIATIDFSLRPILNQSGQVILLIAEGRDITDRKRLEQEVAVREARLNAFFNYSPVGMGIVDNQLRFVQVNEPMAQINNLPAEQHKGRSLRSVLPRLAPMLEPLLQQVLMTYQPIPAIEISGEAPQDASKTVYWLASYHPILNSIGRATGVGVVVIDISARKRTEAILRESDRRWRSLLDNVQLLVVGLDRSGHVEYANPFFLELTEFTIEEVLGKNWMEHFVPAGQKSGLQNAFQEVIEHNFHPHYQNAILTRSGAERMVAWSNTLLQDADGNAIGTISIGEDITERYHLERMKAEFVSVVSHELRTPLTSMQASLSLLACNILDPNSEEGQEVLQIARSGVNRLVRLVNDILDLERLKSGKIRIEKCCCNLADLIATAVAQMQEMANQTGVTLYAPSANYSLLADPDRLLQVLTNLLSNAIKFSTEGGTVSLTVAIVQHPTSRHLLCTVADQGRGIPSDKLESIFERFQQVDASDSREKGGTGLGLAICRSIIQQHGGKIWAESILGQGSKFCFTLPMHLSIEEESCAAQ